MGALLNKMRMTKSKKADNFITPQTEDKEISSSTPERNCLTTSVNLKDIVASGSKRRKPIGKKLKGIEEELLKKNVQDEKCRNGKNYRTFELRSGVYSYARGMYIRQLLSNFWLFEQRFFSLSSLKQRFYF